MNFPSSRSSFEPLSNLQQILPERLSAECYRSVTDARDGQGQDYTFALESAGARYGTKRSLRPEVESRCDQLECDSLYLQPHRRAVQRPFHLFLQISQVFLSIKSRRVLFQVRIESEKW